MTDKTTESAWVEDACAIFDEHAQKLGWSRHIYSDYLRAQTARISELGTLVPPQVRMEEIGDGDWQDIGPQTLLEARNDALREAAKAIEFKYNDADTDQNGDPKLSWAHEEILALIKDPTT